MIKKLEHFMETLLSMKGKSKKETIIALLIFLGVVPGAIPATLIFIPIVLMYFLYKYIMNQLNKK